MLERALQRPPPVVALSVPPNGVRRRRSDGVCVLTQVPVSVLGIRAPWSSSANSGGFALVFCVLFVLLLTTVISALVPLAITERWLSRSAVEAAQCRYAAAAVVNHAIGELQARTSWDSALDGSAPASFRDTTRVPRLSGSRTLDLDLLGGGFGPVEPGSWGADTPVWSLFAWGPAGQLAPGAADSTIYVALWIADDEDDGDGQPGRDTNGRVRLRGEAFGPLSGHAALIASVQREIPAPAALRLLDWRIP